MLLTRVRSRIIVIGPNAVPRVIGESGRILLSDWQQLGATVVQAAVALKFPWKCCHGFHHRKEVVIRWVRR